MSDVELLMSALIRVQFVCRSQGGGLGPGDPRISPHQAHLLGLLDIADPAMVTELAESMGVTASTMSLNLKRLRDAGLVSCERDPQDRRVMNVRLTEAGDRAKIALRPLDVDRLDILLRALRPEDRRRTLEGLAALAEAADAVLTGSASEG